MQRDILDQLLTARDDRRAVAVITDLASGAQRIVGRDEMADDVLAAHLAEGFRFDKSGVVTTPSGEWFIQIDNPPLEMIIIGAVHIAQSVIPIARLAGYRVIVIDPRGAFATPERFQDVDLYAEWPDEVLAGLKLDERSALLALTHDPKIDDPALKVALSHHAFMSGRSGRAKRKGCGATASRRWASTIRRWRASMAPSASTSGRAGRRKSPSPSWPRSPAPFDRAMRRQQGEIRRNPGR